MSVKCQASSLNSVGPKCLPVLWFSYIQGIPRSLKWPMEMCLQRTQSLLKGPGRCRSLDISNQVLKGLLRQLPWRQHPRESTWAEEPFPRRKEAPKPLLQSARGQTLQEDIPWSARTPTRGGQTLTTSSLQSNLSQPAKDSQPAVPLLNLGCTRF